jgi:preprotein translocase subunit SecB
MNPTLQNQIKLLGYILKKANWNLISDLGHDETSRDFDMSIFFENTLRQENNGFITEFNLILLNKSKSLEISLLFEFTFETEIAIDAAFLESNFCKINAPAISFPMIRAFVTTISANAGIPAIILPSINFAPKK